MISLPSIQNDRQAEPKVKEHRHAWKHVPHPTNPNLSNPLTRKCSGCGRLEYLGGDFVTWKEWPKQEFKP